jgi:transcriptional regulator with XRE-family HTH domain
MKSVSTRIRMARCAARLTQAEVAALLGVGRSAVAQWERAAGSRPSVSHLTARAGALDCSFEWLATGRGSRNLASAAGAGADTTAVLLQNFAHDDEEERILAVFRTLDAADREMVLALADALAEKALAQRVPKRLPVHRARRPD